MDRIAILFNPSAGKGKALKKKCRLKQLLQKWEVPADLIVTADEENLRVLTRECAGRYEALAGAGGDSTFQIMIDEIAGSGAQVDFGLIALGSSNDIAREFDLDSLEKACRALKNRRTRTIDLGAVEHRGKILKLFIGQANIGLGAKVNRFVAELTEKAPRLAALQTWAGIWGIGRAYGRKEIPLPLAVQAGEQKVAGSYIAAVFSNIRFWATGRKLNPSAVPDDGRLDGCLIADCRFLRLARLARLARGGKHAGAPEVRLITAPAFEISSEREFEIQVDGEIIKEGGAPLLFNDIRIRAVPRGLRLIC